MLGALHSPFLNELVPHILVGICTWCGPAILNTQQEVLELVLSFHLQQHIECVCDGDGCSRQLIGLEVGGGLVQSHADIEVSFSDHELHQPKRRGGELMSRTRRQEGFSASQVTGAGAQILDVPLLPGGAL